MDYSDWALGKAYEMPDDHHNEGEVGIFADALSIKAAWLDKLWDEIIEELAQRCDNRAERAEKTAVKHMHPTRPKDKYHKAIGRVDAYRADALDLRSLKRNKESGK